MITIFHLLRTKDFSAALVLVDVNPPPSNARWLTENSRHQIRPKIIIQSNDNNYKQ